MFNFKENNLRARPERKRILQKACFSVKRMRFSKKLRQSVPLDEIYGTWNCICWNIRNMELYLLEYTSKIASVMRTA
jgi:hypothetical protein